MALVPRHLKFSGWHSMVHVMKSDLHSKIRDADFASCACTWQSVFAFLKQHKNVEGQLSRTIFFLASESRIDGTPTTNPRE